MTVELTTDEAAILIAVLQFAEGAAPVLCQPLVEAIADLRSWRSSLLRVFLTARIADTPDRELTGEQTAAALGAFVAQKEGEGE